MKPHRLLVSLLAFAIVVPLTAHAADPTPGRPNILFLLTDDQRYDTLGVTGNTLMPTPQLDRLAKDGILFDNSFVVSSACAPNRAAILSGMFNRSMGVRDFSADFPPEISENLYPFVVQRAGYSIGFIGKWGVASTIDSTIEPYAKRFDFWRGFTGQGDYYTEERQDRHLTQVMADQVAEFLDFTTKEKPGQPWCLSVSFKAPHGPWDQFDLRFSDLLADTPIPYPPTLTEEEAAKLPPFLRTYRLSLNGTSIEKLREVHARFTRAYYRLIAGIDEAVGRIRADLEARGLADNTIIIFSSDNGHFLHEWGFHGKWLMHEPSIRVPLIAVDPRLPENLRGRRSDAITLSIDYAPTMIQWAGAEIPANMQGRSLVPLIEGETPADWRTDFFYDYIFEMFPGDIPKSIGVRDSRWKYIRYTAPRPQFEQLFDLENDPLELVNLAADPAHADTLNRLRERLEEYRQSLPDITPDFQEYADEYEVVGIGADFPDGEIAFGPERSVGQTFRAETAHLVAVEWRWPFFMMQKPAIGVVVTLREDGPEGAVLATTSIPAEALYNLNLARATFDMPVTPGRTYYVGISPDGKPGRREIGLWQYTTDTYPDGSGFIDGVPVEGDIPLSFVFKK
jgi:arylsulfatase A-like enzyme